VRYACRGSASTLRAMSIHIRLRRACVHGDLFCPWYGMFHVLLFFFERPPMACMLFWCCGPGAGWGAVDQLNQQTPCGAHSLTGKVDVRNVDRFESAKLYLSSSESAMTKRALIIQRPSPTTSKVTTTFKAPQKSKNIDVCNPLTK
jgi:hypothetical protein